MSNVTLKVNGRAQTLDVDPSTPLLYILRNDLGLQGPRFGCGLGQCGACTVIINGAAVRSCITPCSAVKGEITTLEGLAKDGTLHPVQRAVVEGQGFQCAFCMPGFVMATVGYLKTNPNPTREQLAHGISGNLCRCADYNKILDVMMVAADKSRGA